MTTDHLREKINMLDQLICNEDVQLLQHQLIVKAAETSTGDAQVDKQIMQTNAANSQAQIKAITARLSVYKAERDSLNAELNA